MHKANKIAGARVAGHKYGTITVNTTLYGTQVDTVKPILRGYGEIAEHPNALTFFFVTIKYW